MRRDPTRRNCMFGFRSKSSLHHRLLPHPQLLNNLLLHRHKHQLLPLPPTMTRRRTASWRKASVALKKLSSGKTFGQHRHNVYPSALPVNRPSFIKYYYRLATTDQLSFSASSRFRKSGQKREKVYSYILLIIRVRLLYSYYDVQRLSRYFFRFFAASLFEKRCISFRFLVFNGLDWSSSSLFLLIFGDTGQVWHWIGWID